jgi:hypothetical protein
LGRIIERSSSWGWGNLQVSSFVQIVTTTSVATKSGTNVARGRGDLRTALLRLPRGKSQQHEWWLSFDLRRLRSDEHDRFVDSVTSGKDNMPSWYGILKIEEIEAIWAYTRATVDK